MPLVYTRTTVKEKIADFLQSRKVSDGILVLSVCLLGVVAFGLGRLSVEQVVNQKPILCQTVTTKSNVAHEVTASVPHALSGNNETELQQNAPQDGQTSKQYVASKNGSVYHLPWCSGAKRIKDENKVWFESKVAAEAAGYRPASNCKGL